MNAPHSRYGLVDEGDREVVDQLIALLKVEKTGDNLYRGAMTREPWPRVFGGQVVGQAVAAAAASTPEDRPIHSLHAYFMRPGNPLRPIIFTVDADMDGRSFSTRRIVAQQDGVPILTMAASFHRPENGLSHALPMPDVAPPEDLPRLWDRTPEQVAMLPEEYQRLAMRRRPIEFRRVEPRPSVSDPGRTSQHLWFRAVAPLPDAPALHRVMLAYASDFFLVEAALLTHGIEVPESVIQGSSLDHAVWFHAPARVDDWLLYRQESFWSGSGRGLCHGRIYSRDGRLVASAAQEGLIRLRRPAG